MFHKVILVGNLGRDPEMRYTPGGQAVCTLSVATNRTWTRDGEQQKETTWFRVTVWGKQAESVNQFLKKGRQVLVEGRLNPDENLSR
jgi:single-strand DNA-binding protein